MLAALMSSPLAADMSPYTQTLHCPNAAGAIIGLTSDVTYHVRNPADGPPMGTNPENWKSVNRANPPAGQRPLNGSFTGTYMQVLPDDRSSYHAIHGEGSFTMTGLEYAFAVKTTGKHTLHLRWTAGDDFGGGDSLYAVLRDYDTDAIITGEDTYKPRLVGINAVPGQFAGCCYHDKTHECPCFDTVQADCPEKYWQTPASASRWNLQCSAGKGEMDAVPAPRWYLYSGQADPTAMSFDAEPWDATCEAEGTGTRDTGLDFAAWDLEAGRKYRLVFYPREDGTAVDAFYLAGPGVDPPNNLRLTAGDSTNDCDGQGARIFQSGAAATNAGRKPARGDWRFGDNPKYDQATGPGKTCGHCLVPVPPDQCPDTDALQTMMTCDNVTVGEMCEADGECNTDYHLNNCDQARKDAEAAAAAGSGAGSGTGTGDGSGPRTRAMRGNNDVYKKVVCADNDVYEQTTVNGIISGVWSAPPSSSDGNPVLVVVLVALVLVAVGGAAFAAHKNRAALAARAKRMRLWIKGEADARPYTRNHEVAGMASATTLPAPSSAIGGGGDSLTVNVPPSTYNPPATF